MVTSPKSILTGQGVAHLWQTVQCAATSSNISQWRIEIPRRVCSSYKNASISRDVAKILSRGLYSKLARGTWVAQTGLHLPQRKQSFTLSAIAPISLCCMINDSCPINPKLGVYAMLKSAWGINLPLLNLPSGSTRFLYALKSLSSSSLRYSSFVIPMPCSPEITPSRERAKAII